MLLRRFEATARQASPIAVMKFYYTYILQSEKEPEHFYTGFTEDLDDRLNAHNSGQVPHTSKHRPWHIKTAVAFTNRQKALDFERYLKSPSGRAFAMKRL
jgi:predicted GIY-YIG superfamily endonuclease